MDEIPNRIKGIFFGLAAGGRIGGPLRMALQVAESLIHCNGFDVEDIAGRYLEWWRQEGIYYVFEIYLNKCWEQEVFIWVIG